MKALMTGGWVVVVAPEALGGGSRARSGPQNSSAERILAAYQYPIKICGSILGFRMH